MSRQEHARCLQAGEDLPAAIQGAPWAPSHAVKQWPEQLSKEELKRLDP